MDKEVLASFFDELEKLGFRADHLMVRSPFTGDLVPTHTLGVSEEVPDVAALSRREISPTDYKSAWSRLRGSVSKNWEGVATPDPRSLLKGLENQYEDIPGATGPGAGATSVEKPGVTQGTVVEKPGISQATSIDVPRSKQRVQVSKATSPKPHSGYVEPHPVTFEQRTLPKNFDRGWKRAPYNRKIKALGWNKENIADVTNRVSGKMPFVQSVEFENPIEASLYAPYKPRKDLQNLATTRKKPNPVHKELPELQNKALGLEKTVVNPYADTVLAPNTQRAVEKEVGSIGIQDIKKTTVLPGTGLEPQVATVDYGALQPERLKAVKSGEPLLKPSSRTLETAVTKSKIPIPEPVHPTVSTKVLKTKPKLFNEVSHLSPVLGKSMKSLEGVGVKRISTGFGSKMLSGIKRFFKPKTLIKGLKMAV